MQTGSRTEVDAEVTRLSSLYETMKNDVNELMESSNQALKKHRDLLDGWKSFKLWCDELQQTFFNASTFSADRYVLLATFDRLNVSVWLY